MADNEEGYSEKSRDGVIISNILGAKLVQKAIAKNFYQIPNINIVDY